MDRKIFFNRYFFVIILLGCGALVSSFIVAEGLQRSPCLFCKLQRIPFALMSVNAVFGLIGPYKGGFFKVILAFLGLGALLGMVHFLMQMLMVPDFCSSQRCFISPEEFLNTLQSPQCSKVSWSVGGIPVSLFNAMLHGITLGVSIRLKTKKKLIRNVI
ncbi:MAG: disulfide bond formation protein B [Chlamydiia bacterium]|nr:disulfide bond formation protein B [Chlamydiia bacterium]